MSTELTCLEIAVVIWAAQFLILVVFANIEMSTDYLFGARDGGEPAASGVFSGRAKRALNNFMESFPVFASLDLALIVTQRGGGWGATIWVVARIIYVPLYLGGVKYVRSLVWGFALAGLIIMFVRLISG